MEEFIHTYPSHDDKKISSKLFRKKEFNELQFDPIEKGPHVHGTPFKTQLLQSRFISTNTLYDRLLLFHAMGTGKTCLESLIVENFKNSLSAEDFSPAIIVTPSRLIENFKNEIANVCTHNIYLPTEKNISASTRDSRITNMISKTYTVTTPHKFLSKNVTLVNKLIIIDEAHHFRPIVKKGDDNELRRYNALKTILQNSVNCRIILMTGTPIQDTYKDILTLMNLILPEDRQLPVGDKSGLFFSANNNLTPQGKTLLQEAMHGRVSYLRAMKSSQKIDQGQIYPPLKYIKLFVTKMSKFQSKVVKTVATDKTVGSNFDKLYASACVLPDSGFSTGDMKKNLTLFKGKVVDGKSRYKSAATLKEISTNIEKYSSKFAAILNEIETNRKELAFIYNYSVNSPGGIINFSEILKHRGYTRVTRVGDMVDNGVKKFISIHGTTSRSSKTDRDLINLFNSRKNKYGSICQVIVGSRKMGEGISLKNVRQVHILLPFWNFTLIEQAIARAYRVNSHEALDKNERVLKVFRHVSVYNNEKDPSPDLLAYSVAEKKDFKNAQIYRLLKEKAWDCPIAYARNVLDIDIDGSRECDYQECNFKCSDFSKNNIDKNPKVWKYSIPEGKLEFETYNSFYSTKQINEMVNDLIKVFNNHFKLSFGEVCQLLDIETDSDRSIILQALNFIISTRMIIKNRYGFECFMNEEKNMYFLDTTMNSLSKYENAEYIENMFLTKNKSLEEFIVDENTAGDITLIKKYCNMKKPDIGIVKNMTYQTQISLLEMAFNYQQTLDEIPPSVKMIIDLLSHHIFYINKNHYHVMSMTNYEGLSHNVSKIGLDSAKGELRKYEPSLGIWADVANKKEKKEIIHEIKDFQKDRDDIGWEFRNREVFSIIDRDIFKLVRKGKGKGKRCNSFSLKELYDVFIKLVFFPQSESISNNYKTKTDKELLTIIRKNKANIMLDVAINDEIDITRDVMLSIIYITTSSNSHICDLLREYMVENNIVEHRK